VIPDPHCSCGIYAGLDELTRTRDPKPPRRVPFVTGFVALSGRVLVDRELLRAQHATIIGPLALTVGRRPMWHDFVPHTAATRSARVVTDRSAFRILWTRRDVGETGELWLKRTARALTAHYRAPVEIVIPN
jgi:hypothetical protein